MKKNNYTVKILFKEILNNYLRSFSLIFFLLIFITGCEVEGVIDSLNNAPNANNQELTVKNTELLEITLSADDIDGDSLFYILVSSPQNGTLAGEGNHFTYHPNETFIGNDNFTFKVNDGTDESNTAQISISVLSSSNQLPTAKAIQYTTIDISPLNIDLNVDGQESNELMFTLVEQPKHGQLSGTPPQLQYTANSGFEGKDNFSYKISNGYADSETAKAYIDVFAGDCQSTSFSTVTSDLFIHLPIELGLTDLSSYHHAVLGYSNLSATNNSNDHSGIKDSDQWQSRVDRTEQSIEINLNDNNLNDESPYSLAFKFQPYAAAQNTLLFSSSAIEVEQNNQQIITRLKTSNDTFITLTFNDAEIKNTSCNQFIAVLSNNELAVYINGNKQTVTLTNPQLKGFTGLLKLPSFNGRLWDFRLYERALTNEEIMLLSENCSENSAAATRFPDYSQYMCGTYVCEYWEDDYGVPIEQFEYYIKVQDEVHERHLFDAAMYPREKVCDFINLDSNKSMLLSKKIIKSFVKPFSEQEPIQREKGHHWLHENFHAFQGRLKSYNGFSGNKFLKESTASWGADSVIPANNDTLLGYYTLDPHLPLWTTQSSPIDHLAGSEFKGGHQYGATIFWSYLTHHVTNKRFIGDIFNDPRAGYEPVHVAYELLADQGINMKDVFSEFSAKISTWDIDNGELYLKAELGSLKRMKNGQPDLENYDNKYSKVFEQVGTGEQWLNVDEQYTPGGWAFNAYKVIISEDATYNVAVKASNNNPEEADFRAKIVVHTPTTGERQYVDLSMLPDGSESSTSIAVNAGDILYLVIAATPDKFEGWDTYRYQYQLYPQN